MSVNAKENAMNNTKCPHGTRQTCPICEEIARLLREGLVPF